MTNDHTGAHDVPGRQPLDTLTRGGRVLRVAAAACWALLLPTACNAFDVRPPSALIVAGNVGAGCALVLWSHLVRVIDDPVRVRHWRWHVQFSILLAAFGTTRLAVAGRTVFGPAAQPIAVFLAVLGVSLAAVGMVFIHRADLPANRVLWPTRLLPVQLLDIAVGALTGSLIGLALFLSP
jgi:hypothetical protein